MSNEPSNEQLTLLGDIHGAVLTGFQFDMLFPTAYDREMSPVNPYLKFFQCYKFVDIHSGWIICTATPQDILVFKERRALSLLQPICQSARDQKLRGLEFERFVDTKIPAGTLDHLLEPERVPMIM